MFYLYSMTGSFFRRFTKRFFVFFNVVVAIIFLLGCYSYWFNPTHFWFIGLFTLASFYLLLALVFFIFFWLFVKRSLMLIGIVAIALAWLPIKHIIKIKPSHNFNVAKQTNTIRIMSWNVDNFNLLGYKKNHAVKNDMLDLINKHNPDIACFQEMVAADTIVDLNNEYYRKYAFYPLSGFDTALGFNNNFYSYNKKNDFAIEQHFGIIIFSKYPIINKKTISIYPHDYNSIFQFVDIVKANDTIRVFNIHLQSLRFSIDNLKYIQDATTKTEIDLEQSKNIISKLKIGFIKRQKQSDVIKKEINESPYPVIICGDFNDVPNSYAYCTIGKGLKNAFAEKGTGIGRTFSGISPTLRIDNIFVDNHFSVDQYTCINKKLSDHFPVISDIYFQP
jgi:endonuclease/exonuclease/phosphatase family metal-dependent hydrolase